ncbi:DMT family transporter [Gottfriedia luciferensis]|uniref:DMT family transporter n=1 Tax=Gottfriedia luciferensis TaxID=178774 RepID=UPI000B4432CF|nr:DMT family transporter [Gottfriedia luciferensis]
MLQALILSLISGSLVGLQNVFNSKVNQMTGIWVTTTFVLGMGFLASFVTGLIVEGNQFFDLHNMKNWYWFSGILGVGVVFCITKGVSKLGPTFAISIVLTSQLISALLFDTQGWLGLEKVPFTSKQLIGVLLIISGILVFKLKGNNVKSKRENDLTLDESSKIRIN